MRGNQVQGRFTVGFENTSIDEGIVDELRSPVGAVVDWWVWDAVGFAAAPADVYDDIYDVSNQTDGKGRMWKEAIRLPAIMAQITRGSNIPNERGFYIVDTMKLTIAVTDAMRLIPDLVTNPAIHIKDRIVHKGEVFYPSRVLPRGRYAENFAVIDIDCLMVNAEELVNDPQFQSYAN